MEEERITGLLVLPEWKTLLLDLVEKNEIDPWNVDIVRLTGLYLEEIKRRKEMDLYLPANAVLASSILLWLKSKALKWEERTEPEEVEEDVVAEVVEPLDTVPRTPEERPEERMEVIVPNRFVRRAVTLDELLEVMERLMRRGVGRKRPKEVEITENVFGELPEEDVEDYVEEVYGEIRRLADSTGMVLLTRLAPSDPLEFVKTLLAVLYLASEGRVELFQEEAFGEVIVKIK